MTATEVGAEVALEAIGARMEERDKSVRRAVRLGLPAHKRDIRLAQEFLTVL
jgi:hypothetical protein